MPELDAHDRVLNIAIVNLGVNTTAALLNGLVHTHGLVHTRVSRESSKCLRAGYEGQIASVIWNAPRLQYATMAAQHAVATGDTSHAAREEGQVPPHVPRSITTTACCAAPPRPPPLRART